MIACADTGFVVSLYKVESTTSQAVATLGDIGAPVLISQLGELEAFNAFQLAVFRREISPQDAVDKRLLFEQDVKDGILTIMPIRASGLYSKTTELAARHSAILGTRTLDLMHVAAALLMGADTFLSFDERQRKAAVAEGLAILP